MLKWKREMASLKVSINLDYFSFREPITIVPCLPEYRKYVSDESLGIKSPKKDIPLIYYPIYIHFYLDGGFGKQKKHVHVIQSPQHLVDGKYMINKRIELYGTPDKMPISCDSKLCAQVYVTALSETGAQCMIDFGTISINMCNLKNEKMDHSVDYHLKLHTVKGNPTKSILGMNGFKIEKQQQQSRFTDKESTSISNEIGEKMIFMEQQEEIFSAQKEDYFNIHENQVKISDAMDKYVEYTTSMESCFQRFMPGAEKIRCPTNPSQVTFNNTETELPIASFVLSAPVITTESFWIQQITIYIQRYLSSNEEWVSTYYENQSIEESKSFFLKKFSKFSIAEKGSVAINVIAQYAQMLEYISDYTVEGNNIKESIESFGDAIVTQSGDCEDLAFAIFQLFRSFLKFSISKGHFMECFKEMKRILMGYVPLMVIEGVTANNIQNASSSVDEQHIGGNHLKIPPELNGAHAALKAIPFYWFHKMLANWSPNHNLTLHVKSEADDFFVKNPDIKPDQLPILIGEGTGILEGGIFEDKLKIERDYVYKSAIMDKMKRLIIPNIRSISPFYQALIFGFTDRYMNSHGIGTFYFATLRPERYYNPYIPGEEEEQQYREEKKVNFRIKGTAKEGDATTPFPVRGGRDSFLGHYVNFYSFKRAVKDNLSQYGKGCTFGDFITCQEQVTLIPNQCPHNVFDSREFDLFLVKAMVEISKIRIPPPELSIETAKILDMDKMTDNDDCVDCVVYDENGQFPATNHLFSKSEFKGLSELVKLFHNDPSMKAFRSGKKNYGIIPIYILEDYIDNTFLNEMKYYFVKNKHKQFVGDVKVFKEYHTDSFYVYRMDLLLYK